MALPSYQRKQPAKKDPREHLYKDTDPRDEDDGGRMGFLEHLDELRMRLIKSCAAIVAGMCVSLVFINRLADVLLASMLARASTRCRSRLHQTWRGVRVLSSICR